MTKIHLGCWHRVIPGWIHVDICDFPHIDFKSDVKDLSFFENNFADIIYASHVIEYFDREEIISVLNEWKRVLKPGGIIRLAVPNFESLIKVYENTKDINNIIGPIFGRMEIYSNKKITIYHKNLFDKDRLYQLLASLGFVDIKEWDWRKTDHSFVDDHSQAYFPHMDKDNGICVSLNMEAIKPIG